VWVDVSADEVYAAIEGRLEGFLKLVPSGFHEE
jgi:hypothetical protein